MDVSVGTELETEVAQRDENGRFIKGASGNPSGRPLGSRNRVTLLKIMGEEAVREDNFDAMLEVCRQTIEAALGGDKQARKLVWDTMTSKGVQESSQAADKVSITINEVSAPKGVTIEGETQDVNRSKQESAGEERPALDAELVEGDEISGEPQTSEHRPRG